MNWVQASMLKGFLRGLGTCHAFHNWVTTFSVFACLQLCYDDWVADTGTTSHICNQHTAFTTYKPLGDKIVSGVGGLKTTVQGIRTVDVESIHKENKYILQLENVLHNPSNPNNLFSLGRWDTSGGRYTGGGGAITLIPKDGKSIARCVKVTNNLYQIKLTI